MGRRGESVVILIGTDCRAGAISNIAINGTVVVSVPCESPLHITFDAIAIRVSPITFNNNCPLLARVEIYRDPGNHNADIHPVAITISVMFVMLAIAIVFMIVCAGRRCHDAKNKGCNGKEFDREW